MNVDRDGGVRAAGDSGLPTQRDGDAPIRRDGAAPAEPRSAPLGAHSVNVTMVGVGQDAGPPVIVDPAATDARLDRQGTDRAELRKGLDEPPHRLLIISPDPAAPDTRMGVVRREVVVDGWRFELEVEPAARAALRDRASRGRAEIGRSGPTQVRAIIPGVVVGVSVAPGDAVTAGQQLLVVEAMKMQNELRAPRDGTIELVAVGPGSTIDVGDLLLVLA